MTPFKPQVRPGLPVVVLTASHDPSVMEALQRQQVSAIIHKPLKEGELLDAVAKVA